MKTTFVIVGVLALCCHFAHAAPVFKVSKDGKTNWLIGTMHDARPLEKEIPFEMIDIVKNSRVVLSEMGGMNEAAQMQMAIAVLGSRQARNLAQAFTLEEYTRLLDFLRDINFNDRMLGSAHGMTLFSTLNGAFAIHENRRLHDRMRELAMRDPVREQAILAKMRETMKQRQISANFEYGSATQHPFGKVAPTLRASLDQTLAAVADRAAITQVPLDSEELMRKVGNEKFEGKELGDFVRNRFQRLDVIEKIDDEAVAMFLVEYMAGLGKNGYRRYCNWQPGSSFSVGAPSSQEVPAVPVPTLIQKLFDRHEMWMDKIEQEFAKGDVSLFAGAGHIVPALNPTGSTLISLLEERGYTIEHVKTKPCE